MTLQKEEKKSVKHAMHYETAGDPRPSKGSARRYVEKEMDNLNMFSIGWYAVKRCKLAISITCNLLFIYMQFHKFIG